MKKAFKWIAVVLLSPVLLFVVLVALLYVPPIQNWVVQRVASYASEQTGMQISIGRVSMSFPLDLELRDVLVIDSRCEVRGAGCEDTIASIRRAVADVRLWPLTDGRVVIDELMLEQAQLKTRDFIGDLRIEGTIGELTLTSPGIDLERMEAAIERPRLRDTDLTIFLSDTAAVDTTSTGGWRIGLDRFEVERTAICIVIDSAALFPDSATRISAYMGSATLSRTDLDLDAGRYSVGALSWANGALAYDDVIALSQVQLGLDSIYYNGTDARVTVSHASLREDSTGVELAALAARLGMTGDDLLVSGQAQLRMPELPPLCPAGISPLAGASGGELNVRTHIEGTLAALRIEELSATLPEAFHAELSGTLGNLMDAPESLQAHLQLDATAYDLDFLHPLLELPPTIQIPHGLRLSGDVEANGERYTARLTARDGQGMVSMDGSFCPATEGYEAQVAVSRLDLHRFMPQDSLGLLTADATVSGQGLDMLSTESHLTADVALHHLDYGAMALDSIQATASLHGGHARMDVTSRNALLSGTVGVDAQLGISGGSVRAVQGTIDADLGSVDLLALGLTADPLTVGMSASAEVESDLTFGHHVSALISDISMRDSVQTYHPEKLGLLLRTTADTTLVRLQSGDLIMKLDAQGDYEQLLSRLTAISDTLSHQLSTRTINQGPIKQMLPTARLYATSQQDNPLANILKAMADVDFRDLSVDLTSSPQKGLNGEASLLSLSVGGMPIDTIRLSLVDRGQGLTFNGQVTNGRRNTWATFNVLLDGLLQEHGASLGVRYFDEQGRRNVRLGAKVEMADEGLRMQLMPTVPTLGYKDFTLNADNYLLLHDNLKLAANVNLTATDGTHISIYSADQDTTMLQDLTISVSRLDLGELTGGMAFLPNVGGTLQGDYHLQMDADRKISVASEMSVDSLSYEGSYIGNMGTDFVYLLREDDSHVVDATLTLGGSEIGTLSGSYSPDGALDGTLSLDAMPLSIINGFIPDQIIGFEGTADGTLSVSGPTSALQANGTASFTDGYLVSQPYGMRMHFGDKPVTITNSRMTFDEFALYAYNDNPLNITGNIDFSNADRSTVDLRLSARNFQLINAKQTRESVAYGKMFVNFFARLSGTLDQLRMRGKLDILGTTDLNYILLDSPLSTDNQMDELVRFTDFSDTTQTVVERPTPDGLDIDLTMSIDEGAHVKCALNADQTNYVDLMGGGDLRLRMDGTDGMTLTGRYTMQSGTMKYSLPVIPLKTFTIADGSYVEFTGAMDNPTLHLTATERTRATVGASDGQSRSVLFDCGVIITQTLENMGLQFTISAPEDMQVQSELASMSTEQRGKLAVTMLTTGMYLADGNTSGFSMNSALSSFLQSEINQITGSALKTLDLQVGLDNSTDASGQMHTDYSFSFAKRFWNNRLSVQIGGKVSTGTEVQGQQQSFFDNVTMEYRLSPTSNQYVKLFYKQNVYDWLDGYTGEYGAGFIWKRKLDNLLDVFRRAKAQPTRPTPNPSPREGGIDSSASEKPQPETNSNDSLQTPTHE